MTQRIGVLALQGNYAQHQLALQSFSIDAPLVYKPSELENLDGLIVPGGESTALLKLMTPLKWQDAICAFKARGKKLFGTCAGMILFAKQVVPEQESLGLIDITVSRNAYGRQLDSHVASGQCDKNYFDCEQVDMVFIRAPKVIAVGSDVKVLATCNDVPVLVQQENVLCASFHPEFLDKSFVHEYFVNLI
jgi:5'-phosphate synthase pdxT subunit